MIVFAPLEMDASLSFVPVPEHGYAVGSELRLLGEGGADIDALNTVLLERILLAPG